MAGVRLTDMGGREADFWEQTAIFSASLCLKSQEQIQDVEEGLAFTDIPCYYLPPTSSMSRFS